MSEAINLLKKADQLEISDQLTGYSKVIIYAGQDDSGDMIVYSAGDDSGKVLEIKNEFGSQLMAENVLRRIIGFQYQPYSADTALLDPAAEIGDGVTINGIYSGIFTRATAFGRLMTSDISAPSEEEIEHEFTVESASDRQYSRFVSATKAALRLTSQEIAAEVSRATQAEGTLTATLAIHATDIAARVTKSGGSRESFGWTLESDHWSVYAGNTEVFRITATGAKVKGTIEADSGHIGGENGFVITAQKLYKNISSFGGSQSSGVYIGTDGIQLGQGFKVDSSGNLTASSGTFSGNIYAKNIQYGGSAGYMSGSGLSSNSVGSGKIVSNSLSTGQFAGGVNTSLGYANYSNDLFNDSTRKTTANYGRFKDLTCTEWLSILGGANVAGNFTAGGYKIKNSDYVATWKSKRVVTDVSASRSSNSVVTGVSFEYETVYRTTLSYVSGVSADTETIYYLGR